MAAPTDPPRSPDTLFPTDATTSATPSATKPAATSFASLADELDAQLAEADRNLEAGFPGARAGRQPVHTVYVPADRYAAGLESRWGAEGVAAIDRNLDLFVALLSES